MPLGRLIAPSIVAGAIGAVSIAAQSAPAVHIVHTTFSLHRGQTTFVRVRVEIPPGNYVPAESRGPFSGARLEVISTSILNRELPTYPTPTPHTLPGLRQPVLAYEGSIDIGMPLFAAPGLNGAQTLHLAFTNQMCDSKRCGPVETMDAVEPANIVEPIAEPFSIAFRLDASRVVIPLTRDYSAVRPDNLREEEPLGTLGPAFTAVPDAQNASVSADDGMHIGDVWTILSNGYAHRASVQHVGFLADGCGDPGSGALSAMASDTLQRDPAKYFLAARSSIAAVVRNRAASASLDTARRTALVDLLNRQFRATYPSIMAPLSLGPGNKGAAQAPRASDVRFDRAVEQGLAKLTYDVQAFRLSPDQRRQFLVRAAWTAGNQSLHMSFWLRSDGREFIVEQTDAWWARQSRLNPGMFGGRDFSPLILNVVPAADGWSYVIVGRRWYESISISALKYSAAGLKHTGIAYSYGC
ncbi:MAG TPA: hypothetical protein VGJ29_13230 [Vicinamibacterales bacterium]